MTELDREIQELRRALKEAHVKPKYRLERRVGAEWYEWGVFTDPARLAEAAFEMGKLEADRIRVTEVKNV